MLEDANLLNNDGEGGRDRTVATSIILDGITKRQKIMDLGLICSMKRILISAVGYPNMAAKAL